MAIRAGVFPPSPLRACIQQQKPVSHYILLKTIPFPESLFITPQLRTRNSFLYRENNEYLNGIIKLSGLKTRAFDYTYPT